ncbi:MAG: hypothetical protein V3R67_03440 [Thermodesulfobacteriota bacterium]
MALPKPSSHTDWTDGAASKVVEPSAAKKLLGWVALERPPFEFMNFLFFRGDEWDKYHESVTDELLAGNVAFDAIVGSGPGTFATINAAVAAVSAGGKIFVKENQALSVTQIINKNDIELTFAPGVVLSQAGGLALGLQIAAERVRVIRPRFTDWITLVTDQPVEFTAASKNSVLDTAFFFNIAIATPVLDNGTNSITLNAIEEQ